jgi:hypothetical protein
MLRRLLESRLFSSLSGSLSTGHVILTWEVRRVFLNLLAAPLYVACFLIYTCYIEAYPPFTEAGDESSAMAVFVPSLLALIFTTNILYTLGYLLELTLRHCGRNSGYLNRHCILALVAMTLIALPTVCCLDYKETLRSNLANST